MKRHLCQRPTGGLLFASLVSILLAQPVASGALITFESDAIGAKANGFASVESAEVVFNDTVGAGLMVNTFGTQSHGKALRVATDSDGSLLEMVFGGPTTDLSLAFGNDDPAYTNVGDLANLRLYNGATQVGQVTVVLNRDDQMNQTISSGPLVFNRATFAYTTPAGSPFTGGGLKAVGCLEIVDDISFTSIPEPGCLSLFALAAMGLCRLRLRCRR